MDNMHDEKLNVLLLDDENDILKALNRVLRMDYNVVTSITALMRWNICRKTNPHHHLGYAYARDGWCRFSCQSARNAA